MFNFMKIGSLEGVCACALASALIVLYTVYSIPCKRCHIDNIIVYMLRHICAMHGHMVRHMAYHIVCSA